MILFDQSYFIKITRNAVKCLNCDEVVESKHRHNYVTCACGNVSVDGGLDYTRRSIADKSAAIDISDHRRYTIDELDDALYIAKRDMVKYTYSSQYNQLMINSIRHYMKLWYNVEKFDKE